MKARVWKVFVKNGDDLTVHKVTAADEATARAAANDLVAGHGGTIESIRPARATKAEVTAKKTRD